MGFDYDTRIPHINGGEMTFTTDENELICNMKNALNETQKAVIPIINDVTNLMSCAKFFNTIKQPEYLDLDHTGEGLFLIKLFSSAEELYQFESVCGLYRYSTTSPIGAALQL